VSRRDHDLVGLIAATLCVALIVFMTAEASHNHLPLDTHHSFCVWCFAAHLASVPAGAALPAASESPQDFIVYQAPRRHSLLLIRLEPVRPPPESQQKDNLA
jgi:hypothetical protein